MWALLSVLGAVPKTLVWDNESAVGGWRQGRPQPTKDALAFAGSLGVKIWQCRPGDPEAKGLVERANGYLETSFLPGRTFTSPQDFNAQLAGWLERANRRRHRRIECRPVDRLPADLAAMVELPPVPPLVGWRTSTRLARDHYVRVASNDYSVHPSAIGRLVDVVAGLEQVRVTCAGRIVAQHDRCWQVHQSLTDPEHDKAAQQMRRTRLQTVAPVETEVEFRQLASYDALFGIEGGVA